MTIRRLDEYDADELKGLFRAFYVLDPAMHDPENPANPFDKRRDIEEHFEKTALEYLGNAKYICFGAEDENGKLVGYITGEIKPRGGRELDTEGFIDDWFVKKDVRNKGMGKLLFNALTEEFKKRKCTHLALDTYCHNQSALNIYHKWGFTDRAVTLMKEI